MIVLASLFFHQSYALLFFSDKMFITMTLRGRTTCVSYLLSLFNIFAVLPHQKDLEVSDHSNCRPVGGIPGERRPAASGSRGGVGGCRSPSEGFFSQRSSSVVSTRIPYFGRHRVSVFSKPIIPSIFWKQNNVLKQLYKVEEHVITKQLKNSPGDYIRCVMSCHYLFKSVWVYWCDQPLP